MSDSGGEFFIGFVVGALAGAAAALLLAPTSGPDLRGQIEQRGVDLRDQAGRWAGDARVRAQQATDDAREQVVQVSERGRIVLADNVRKVQQAVQDTQTRLSEQPANDATSPV